MHLKISHVTRYHYDEPVRYALNQLRLTPKARAGQKVIRWRTEVEGGKKELSFLDHHHNVVELASFSPGMKEIAIVSEGEVETRERSGVVGEHAGYAPLWYFRRPTPLTQPGPRIAQLVRELGSGFDGDIARLHGLMHGVLDRVRYETGKTHPEVAAEEALAAGYGVCQDHAHVFLAAARLLGFPARYVSGYLMMNDRVDQEAGHAWAEAYVEGVGWIAFDVSNGISADQRYVAVATGLDYKEAAPISGMRFGQVGEAMSVAVQVEQQ